MDTPLHESDDLSRRRRRIQIISMLISDASPFREVLSELPPAELQLGKISDASCLWTDGDMLVVGPELFESESLELGLPERILQVVGESVKAVSFHIDWEDLSPRKTDANVVVRKFVALVKMYCPNVEELKLADSLFEEPPFEFETAVHALLEQFLLQLRSIQWYRSFHLTFVPDISVCRHSRELNIPASPQLIKFLRSFGESLESLTVSFNHPKGHEEIIDLIERNCTKLATLSFSECLPVETVGEERYASLLCSFGSQLRCAQVFGLSVGKLARVL